MLYSYSLVIPKKIANLGKICLMVMPLMGCNPIEQKPQTSTTNDKPETITTQAKQPTVATPIYPQNLSQASNATGDLMVSSSVNPTQLPSEIQATSVVYRPDVSQQFMGTSDVEIRLATALPEIPYSTENLSEQALAVNNASWQASSDTPKIDSILISTTKNATKKSAKSTHHISNNLDKNIIIKIQALLNWHHFGVGAVDGSWNKNVIKAMQAYQQANDLPITDTMDEVTWQSLTADSNLMAQPVLVNYTLQPEDINIPTGQSQYRSIKEGLGEKFHMSVGLINQLNPKTPLKIGEIITVYNPYQPNTIPITKVVANKRKNILYAYDSNGNLVASYPTTVGSPYTPSPTGIHHVRSRVINPTYSHDFKDPTKTILPGPNNPVGRIWMGLDKPGYGIHGSPEPEMISRQGSHGCIRLTNWDALALFGTMQPNAIVEFVTS